MLLIQQPGRIGDRSCHFWVHYHNMSILIAHELFYFSHIWPVLSFWKELFCLSCICLWIQWRQFLPLFCWLFLASVRDSFKLNAHLATLLLFRLIWKETHLAGAHKAIDNLLTNEKKEVSLDWHEHPSKQEHYMPYKTENWQSENRVSEARHIFLDVLFHFFFN